MKCNKIKISAGTDLVQLAVLKITGFVVNIKLIKFHIDIIRII